MIDVFQAPGGLEGLAAYGHKLLLETGKIAHVASLPYWRQSTIEM